VNELQRIGKEGEYFVMRKLFEKGFKLGKILDDMQGIDDVFVKNNKQISIQVKTSKEWKSFEYSKELPRTELGYLDVNWNYVIFTDLVNCWIFPYEYLKRKSETGFTIMKVHDIFKDRFDLLELNEEEIMIFLIDNKIANS